MIKKILEVSGEPNTTLVYNQFNDIMDVKQYLDNNKALDDVFTRKASTRYDASGYFCGTETYDEAEELLLHGWDLMSKKLNKCVEVSPQNIGIKNKTKSVYDTAGYQCSVPRYLQNIPTNMINKKQYKAKNKVINVVKLLCYNVKTSQETIIEQSEKVLNLVIELENKGYRVNLSVCCAASEYDCCNGGLVYIHNVKIKHCSQRLNIKQIAFPLCHPSMLRRIFLAITERLNECHKSSIIARIYGYPISKFDSKYIKMAFKDCYVIPPFVTTDTITNIEQYKI